jgi:hypothetical protein
MTGRRRRESVTTALRAGLSPPVGCRFYQCGVVAFAKAFGAAMMKKRGDPEIDPLVRSTISFANYEGRNCRNITLLVPVTTE